MTTIYTKPLIMRQANLIERKTCSKKGGSCPRKPVGAIRDINSKIHYTNGRAGLWPLGVSKLMKLWSHLRMNHPLTRPHPSLIFPIRDIF
jgi:hypothetical protein